MNVVCHIPKQAMRSFLSLYFFGRKQKKNTLKGIKDVFLNLIKPGLNQIRIRPGDSNNIQMFINRTRKQIVSVLLLFSLLFLFRNPIELRAEDLFHHFQSLSTIVKADFLKKEGELSGAVEMYERFLENELRNPIKRWKVILSTLLKLCDSYERLSNFDLAMIKYMEMLKLAMDLNDQYYIVKSLEKIGDIHYLTCHYDLSINSFDKAIDIMRETNWQNLRISVIAKKAMSYLVKGEYGKSASSYKDALRLSQLQGINNQIIENLIGLGVAKLYLNQDKIAYSLIQQALRMARDRKYLDLVVRRFTDLAIGLSKTGHVEKLNKLIGDILQTAEYWKFQKNNKIDYFNLGHHNILNGNYAKAIMYLKKSIEIKSTFNNGDISVMALRGLSKAYLALSEFEKNKTTDSKIQDSILKLQIKKPNCYR